MKVILTILTILSSFLANLEQKTLQTNFNVTVSADAASPINYPGNITVSADKFLLTMFGLEAAYDGKTLYMYNSDADELTLTNPTNQELVEANPFLFARSMVEVCNVTERTTGDETIITLTPKDASIGINRFVLRLRTADLMPLQLDIKEGKKTTVLKLIDPQFVTEQPAFEIKPEQNTYVNDLRI